VSDINFKESAWSEYLYWQKQDKKTLKKINDIIKDLERNGNEGIGKSEKLKGNLSGYWSRRIDQKNRIIYTIENDKVNIFSCKGHYGDK